MSRPLSYLLGRRVGGEHPGLERRTARPQSQSGVEFVAERPMAVIGTTAGGDNRQALAAWSSQHHRA